MKTKKLFFISYFIIMFGWFPFMFLAAWASWDRELGLIVAMAGLSVTLVGSLLFLFLCPTNDIFKSLEELEKEKEMYRKSREKLEKHYQNLLDS